MTDLPLAERLIGEALVSLTQEIDATRSEDEARDVHNRIQSLGMFLRQVETRAWRRLTDLESMNTERAG